VVKEKTPKEEDRFLYSSHSQSKALQGRAFNNNKFPREILKVALGSEAF